MVGDEIACKQCGVAFIKEGIHQVYCGVPPLKWSTHWDRNILFRRTIRWQASETNRKTSF